MSTEPKLSGEIARLYRRAFEEFGAMALWSSRPVPHPTAADALAITRSLRVEGNMTARRLAEEIEDACRRAVEPIRSDDLSSLYRRAFEEFGARALWSNRPVPHPTAADGLAITRGLRTHGGMDGRRLAERIEALCRTDQ